MSEKEEWLDLYGYDESEKCAICVKPLDTTQAIFQLHCGHKFHNNCLVNWCKNNQGDITCPLCQAPIDIDVCNSVWAFKEQLLDESFIDTFSPHILSIYEKGSSAAGKFKKRRRRRRKTTTKKRRNNKKTRTKKNRRQMRK